MSINPRINLEATYDQYLKPIVGLSFGDACLAAEAYPEEEAPEDVLRKLKALLEVK